MAATSPTASSRRSATSSAASLKKSGDSAQPRRPTSSHSSGSQATASLPVDTLVNHLLAAKRSLSSMTLVLRGHEIATQARSSFEDASILAAQAGFLRAAVLDQATILVRLRRRLQETYDWGGRDFRQLVRAMDEADGALEETMGMLRGTAVQSVLRSEGAAGRKTLMDFIDEESVHGMREAMKKSIGELQGIQQSFDGDLLRFDTDIRHLKKLLSDAPIPSLTDDDQAGESEHMHITERLDSLIDHSSTMAELLASLTTHFDMCVTAIRTTEGAAALARRKAAEVTQSQGSENGGVSISGVIAEQESNDVSDLEPKTAKDRAEMLKVVVQDAGEVDDVVQEIQARLAAMEHESSILEDQAELTRRAYTGVLEAYAALGEIGDRLPDYMAAEGDFRQRWELEKDSVHAKLREMTDLREFYERYASAYDSLVLEVDRRKGVDERIGTIWRKAQDSVDKILEADQLAREAFRHDVGEFLPTDLWEGMQGPARRWKVVAVGEDGEVVQESDAQQQTPAAKR